MRRFRSLRDHFRIPATGLEPFLMQDVVRSERLAAASERSVSVDSGHGINYEAWSMPGWILLTVAVLSIALLMASLFGDDVCGVIC
jgi:hypothetical protein